MICIVQLALSLLLVEIDAVTVVVGSTSLNAHISDSKVGIHYDEMTCQLVSTSYSWDKRTSILISCENNIQIRFKDQ